MKVVINKRYGGFSISEKALYRIAELKGVALYPETGSFGFTTYWTCAEKPDGILSDVEFHKASFEDRVKSNDLYTKNTMDLRPDDRQDHDLIKAIEELGEEANGTHAKLVIVEIPDGVDHTIEEYDGLEHIAEKHRTWG